MDALLLAPTYSLESLELQRMASRLHRLSDIFPPDEPQEFSASVQRIEKKAARLCEYVVLEQETSGFMKFLAEASAPLYAVASFCFGRAASPYDFNWTLGGGFAILLGLFCAVVVKIKDKRMDTSL